jgi:hypothetical protein
MNPFELRYSLINTAKDLLTQQYEAQMKIWETASKTVEKFTEAAPKFPTAEEIIEQAIEMNKFISGSIETELVNGVKKLHRITAVF